MNRRSFLKGIFVVSIAPKIIKEVLAIQTKNIQTSVINQSFFDAAFSGSINNHFYKDCYNINIISGDSMSEWLKDFKS